MMNKEDNICWFHGKVSREVAEQILINGNVEFKNLFPPSTLKNWQACIRWRLKLLFSGIRWCTE